MCASSLITGCFTVLCLAPFIPRPLAIFCPVFLATLLSSLEMYSSSLLQDLDFALGNYSLNLPTNFEPLEPKISLDWHDQDLIRLPRSPCPSGVGNLGFNSFNFLTFMVMVFNAVANVNNNINNNNNNDQDINLNSISQDSNSVVANSDNQNSVMAIILPIPAGRKKRGINKKICPVSVHSFVDRLVQDLRQMPECSEYVICRYVLEAQDLYQLEYTIGQNGQPLTIDDCKSKNGGWCSLWM